MAELPLAVEVELRRCNSTWTCRSWRSPRRVPSLPPMKSVVSLDGVADRRWGHHGSSRGIFPLETPLPWHRTRSLGRDTCRRWRVWGGEDAPAGLVGPRDARNGGSGVVAASVEESVAEHGEGDAGEAKVTCGGSRRGLSASATNSRASRAARRFGARRVETSSSRATFRIRRALVVAQAARGRTQARTETSRWPSSVHLSCTAERVTNTRGPGPVALAILAGGERQSDTSVISATAAPRRPRAPIVHVARAPRGGTAFEMAPRGVSVALYETTSTFERTSFVEARRARIVVVVSRRALRGAIRTVECLVRAHRLHASLSANPCRRSVQRSSSSPCSRRCIRRARRPRDDALVGPSLDVSVLRSLVARETPRTPRARTAR